MNKNENAVTFEEDELRIHNLLRPRPCWFQPHGRLVSSLGRHLAWYIKGGQSRDQVSMRNLMLEKYISEHLHKKNACFDLICYKFVAQGTVFT